MRLVAGNTWARLDDPEPGAARLLYDHLSVKVPGAEHSVAYKAEKWDGKRRLFSLADQRFPSGLVRFALQALRDGGFDPAIEDVRSVPCPWVLGRAAWLYPDQAAALAACRARTRGVIQAPTGSGKTEIFVGAAASVPETRVVLLTGSRDLCAQAAARFEKRTGERAGHVGGGRWAPARFTVATYQALHRRRTKPEFRSLVLGAGMLIVDEGHELPASSFFDTAMAFENAYWRVGLSATPLLRRDAQEVMMMAALGVVIHKVDPAPLVADGRLAQPYIWFVEYEHPQMSGSWSEVYEAAIVLNAARNRAVLDLAAAECQRGPTIVFVKSVEHGRILDALFKTAGLRVAFVHGDTPNRAAYAERLVRRDLDVLIASKVFFTGVDIPAAEAGINAGGGDSAVDAVQRLGRLTRGRRIVPGKTSCRYYDFRDLGIPWLSRHSLHRWNTYKEYGFTPQAVRMQEGIQNPLLG